MVTPLVSAIVLNYRTPKQTWRCVEALLQQTIADRMEILVIDNHSGDDSVGYLRNRARGQSSVRVLETADNIGYGQGNNAGIRQAQGELLLIINPDNTLEPTGAERMATVMQEQPDIGVLSPQLVHEDGSIRDSSRSFPSLFDVLIKRTFLRRLFPKRLGRYLRQSDNPSNVQDVDWVVGACMMIRRTVYEDIGGFDPRFFLFFEDTDLCRRCHQAGYRVVHYPLAKATDRKWRLSEGGFLTLFTKKTARIHLLSAVKYFWKWRGHAR